MTLARAIESARAHDLRAHSSQEAATRRLLANISAIEERLRFHRAAVDDVFFARRDAARGASSEIAGEATLADYPLGFCGVIRDQVLARLVADDTFRKLIGPDVVLKKIFVLLKGVYFQNALQLGNLYVDVANDTVFIDKPKIEWLRIADTPFENADSWSSVAAVGSRYYEVELYPNLLFPLAFPAAPFFAIRSSGRIDFFQAQDILFLKDLGDGLRRTRALLDDPAFLARPCPNPTACFSNAPAAATSTLPFRWNTLRPMPTDCARRCCRNSTRCFDRAMPPHSPRWIATCDSSKMPPCVSCAWICDPRLLSSTACAPNGRSPRRRAD